MERNRIQQYLGAGLPTWRFSVQEFAASYVANLRGMDLKNVSLLDLGCGNGYMLARLSSKLSPTARLVGIDVNRNIISRAMANVKDIKEKAKIEFRCANAENLTFKNGEFDVIAANLSFSAFRRPAKVASVTSHMLKPRGRLIMSEVSSIRPLGKLGQLVDAASGNPRYNLFSPTSLTNLFIPYGFKRTIMTKVPLEQRLLRRHFRIPRVLSPVFLIELSRPSFLYGKGRDRYPK